jgi:formylglycine-generating enzyme required for sulfatase activity
MKKEEVSQVSTAGRYSLAALAIIAFGCSNVQSQTQPRMPSERIYTNSIGMKLVRIEPGRFTMGFGDKPLTEEVVTRPSHFSMGDFDEHPTHKVKITKPFYVGIYEVTNAQYEQFDPSHKKWQGRRGYSKGDDEAVVYVSWDDAARFCDWLSRKEGLPYRLPTEAEWEYACRGGTTTAFHTGDALPKESVSSSGISLTVGRKKPNPWGLYDTHGNVEEWCYDWYGPYEPGPQVDPVGREDGNFKVARGGSHSTESYYLRSANRSGSLGQDRQWLIGFRAVLGEMPQTAPGPVVTESHQRYVKQNVPADISNGPDPDKPYFNGPRVFVKIPKDATGPLFGYHNHFIAVTDCPNGDLLAAWFSCIQERGRELGIAASRLRYGHEQWEPASVFWDAPDRNDHTTAFWNDGEGTIYHFNALGVSYRDLAILLRKSKDKSPALSSQTVRAVAM